MSYDTTFAVKCENKVIEQSLLGPRLPRRFLAANRVNRNRGRQYQVEVLLRILSQYRGRSAGKHECSRIVATHSHNFRFGYLKRIIPTQRKKIIIHDDARNARD